MIWRGETVLRNPSNARARPRRSGCAGRASRRRRSATWSSSAPARPGWPPRSTAPRRGWRRRARRRRHRRPGRHLVADRELPRLPGRHLRRELAERADDPGGEVRRADQRAAPRRRRSSRRDGHYVVRLDDGGEYRARSGRDRHRRPLPAARRPAPRASSRGRASTTPRPRSRRSICRGDPVAVVGGGNSAGQARCSCPARADRCTCSFAGGRPRRRHVALPGRPDRADLARRGAAATPRCASWSATAPSRRSSCENNRTGERHELDARALFVFIGAEPHTGWLGDAARARRRGFILTGRDVAGSTAGDRAGAARH